MDIQLDFFSMFDSLNVGFLFLDYTGKPIYANYKWEDITGTNLKDWGCLSSNEIYTTDDILPTQTALKEKGVFPKTVYSQNREIICDRNIVYDKNNTLKWIVFSLVDLEELNTIKNRLQQRANQLETQQKLIRENAVPNLDEIGIIFRDHRMFNIYQSSTKMAFVDAPLMILGESGVGKEVLAKYIHDIGNREHANFVHLNCSAIPDTLFESELFGYEPGTFTGASSKGKQGLLQIADKGTLFLDEIGDLSLPMQVKLLFFLQEMKFNRVGGVRLIPVDVRIISATNKDLKQMMREGTFREDLYYRLNLLEITIPPLRERKNDIPSFVYHFTKEYNAKYKKNIIVSQEVIYALMNHNWLGNVRELKHLIQFMLTNCESDRIELLDLPETIIPKTNVLQTNVPKNQASSLKEMVEQAEEAAIRYAIINTSNLKEAAQLLDIEISTLTKKKQRYNIYLKKK